MKLFKIGFLSIATLVVTQTANAMLPAAARITAQRARTAQAVARLITTPVPTQAARAYRPINVVKHLVSYRRAEVRAAKNAMEAAKMQKRLERLAERLQVKIQRIEKDAKRMATAERLIKKAGKDDILVQK